MGKDIFGHGRFFCTQSGCSCEDFLSRAQQELGAVAEDDLEARDLMESRYHSMTCQAKSIYQLTCATCCHDAVSHSSTPRPNKLKEDHLGGGMVAAGKEPPGILQGDGPCTYQVIHGLCIRKDNSDPSSTVMVKSRCKVGCEFCSTGRSWRGPSGGLWAELESKIGWVLVEGQGFGVDGPLLRRCAAR